MKPLARAPRARVVFAVATTVLFLAGLAVSGVSTAEIATITGHSTYFDGDHFDPCLAAVAGIEFYMVRWFNDQALTISSDKDSYIYATEHNASDPRDQTLLSSGRSFDFMDPNMVEWDVQEWYWQDTPTHAENASPPLGSLPNLQNFKISANGTVESNRTYVWTVKVGKMHYDAFHGDDPHGRYNFVLMLDECKMHNNSATWSGMVPEGSPAPGEPAENSGSHFVDLYVGSRPKGAPAGSDLIPNELHWSSNNAGSVGNDPPGTPLPVPGS